MDEERVLSADVLAYLACCLQEWLGLDIANGAADFGDDDVGSRLAFTRFGGGQAHTALDLVGDVRDDLDGVAKVLAAAFAFEDGGVNLSGGHVGAAR